jgi:hypothetical protein
MTDLEKAEALAGGVEVTVTKRDKSTEQVKVRQLPVLEMRGYAKVVDDEAAMVELFCDRRLAGQRLSPTAASSKSSKKGSA